ncbi:hypothetical protein OJAV_G00005760 [Oryzias javanicus]|uniref:Caspase-6 n=1 Tax=Oryzias javanicus TaxID=123683 RepID=A0A3S2PHR4_ORYJA|nr:hypothetical protein OJAV_G00005760 [Oryzias javanicus]
MATDGGSVEKDSKRETKHTGTQMTETDSFNTLPDLNPAEEYKMNRGRRGLALIFNHERFYWRLGLNDRSGTNADRYNLEKRLQDLSFDVRSYDNAKQTDVLDRIHEAAEEDHSDADCFLLVFLSHGENNYVYTYDGMINIQEITAAFRGDKCRSLIGKPKIFVFQACRGDKHDSPVVPSDAVDHKEVINEVVIDASALNTLPAGADFLMCYSVAEGFYSHRETINGSWYIQDLCELLKKYGDTLEFTELLTLVNRKVAMRSVGMCRDPNAIGKKQVPCFASMLTKKLYFRKK